MTSDQTPHSARITESGAWVVSWLPARELTHNQAVTAMTIAEVIGAHAALGDPLHAGHKLWLHVDGWAAELGLTGPESVAMASASPEGQQPAGDAPGAGVPALDVADRLDEIAGAVVALEDRVADLDMAVNGWQLAIEGIWLDGMRFGEM